MTRDNTQNFTLHTGWPRPVQICLASEKIVSPVISTAVGICNKAHSVGDGFWPQLLRSLMLQRTVTEGNSGTLWSLVFYSQYGMSSEEQVEGEHSPGGSYICSPRSTSNNDSSLCSLCSTSCLCSTSWLRAASGLSSTS